MEKFIAFDVGAGSGRAVIGEVTPHSFHLHEVARFANPMVRVRGRLHWDALRIYSEIVRILGEIARQHPSRYTALAVDTWAVDFGLLDDRGDLIGSPVCYRDSRTDGMMEAVCARVPRQSIFEQTGGVQFLTFNTLYQLFALARANSGQLAAAQTLLMMPDLMNYWLTGVRAVEFTNATTTQFFDSLSGTWARGLLDALDIPHHFLPPVIQPGTILGEMSPAVAEETGLHGVRVIATATHDTAAAAAAVPAEGASYAWLSSGTWSLLGAVADAAIVTPEALRYNISSYGGPDGGILPWKNIMGLWLVEECRRIWAREGAALDYETMVAIAADARPFTAVIDPDDAAFLAPDDMPQAIRDYCARTGQTVPHTKGEILRTAFEALALRYRWVLEKLEIVTGRPLDVLHIVGGGAKNRLLCQFTADASGRRVIAGPVEATAIGNVTVQAVATGVFADLQAARAVIRSAFDTVTYLPADGTDWDTAYRTFCDLVG